MASYTMLAAGFFYFFIYKLFVMIPHFARKAETENDVKWLHQFHPLQILDSIPENKYISKDSGRWLIHDDDDEVVLEQKGDETFPAFIKRYALSILQGDNDAERETLCTNLATINLWKAIKAGD